MATKHAELMEDIVTYEVGAREPERKTGHDRKFDTLLNSFEGQDNVKLAIYRQRGGLNDGLTFLDTFPVDKYDYEGLHVYIRDSYGEGDYRVQIRENGKLRANELITIEVPKTKENYPTVQSNDSMGIINSVLERMDVMNQRMMEMQQNTGGNDRMAMLQEMLVMKQLFSDGGNKSSMHELLETIQGLQGLGINIGGSGEQEKNDGFMAFLGQMAEPLGQIIQGTAMSTQSKDRATMRHPLTQPQPQTTQPKEPTMVNPKLMFIKASIGTLINAAAKKSDPTLYADVVMDQIPDAFFPQFIGMLEKDEWFAEMTSIHPGVKDHAEWFTSLRNEILLALSETDDGEPNNESDNVHSESDPERGGGD